MDKYVHLSNLNLFSTMSALFTDCSFINFESVSIIFVYYALFCQIPQCSFERSDFLCLFIRYLRVCNAVRFLLVSKNKFKNQLTYDCITCISVYVYVFTRASKESFIHLFFKVYAKLTLADVNMNELLTKVKNYDNENCQATTTQQRTPVADFISKPSYAVSIFFPSNKDFPPFCREPLFFQKKAP